MIKLLGEGAYGKAYLVRSNTDRRYCVIKIINIENMTEKEKKDTLTESRILKQLVKEIRLNALHVTLLMK